MSNLVDTSLETVNMEFDAAERDIGPENTEPPTSPEQAAMDEAQQQAEIAMATGLINTSLSLGISTLSGVSVSESATQQASESYAVLILKYFPGGIFALLDRYKEELAAVTATFVLIKAVSKAKEKQREEEEKNQEAEKQTSQATPNQPPQFDLASQGLETQEKAYG